MQRFPVVLDVEFRGVSDARNGKPDPETGEIKVYRELKFERLVGDADISVIEVPASEFARAKPAFDWAGLERGDRVTLTGEVVLADRGERYDDGSPRRSYFTIAGGRVEVARRPAAVKAA